MDKQIKVTLVKSTIGCTAKQKATGEALGLKKVGSSKVLADNAGTKGRINIVAHLVKVEEA